MKTCTKCNQEFPATTEYFYPKAAGKFGVDSSCKVCHRTGKKEWYINNTELKLARDKKHYEQNKATILERNRKYYQNNKDKHLIKSRVAKSRRRARVKGNGWAPYTEEQMLDKYGTICYLCNQEIDLQAPRSSGAPGWEKSLWKEHVVAIANGGSDTLDNVKPSHALCNLNKGTKEQNENQTA